MQDSAYKIPKSYEEIEKLKLENNLLLTQLHRLQEQLESFYNNASPTLKSSSLPPSISEERLLYGAAEKVKSDLSYQLGSKIINTPLKPKKILALPKELFLVYKAYPKENSQIDLDSFKDANEAEKVKNHLSYKIGSTLVEGFSSPTKFMKMPVKMAKEFITFKIRH